MAKKDYITITGSDLYKGMADSAYFGISEIRNMDITTTPGIAKIAPKMTKVSGNVVTQLITCWDTDPVSGTVWAMGESGQCYRYSAGTWSTVSGFTGSSVKGAIVYKDYFIVACNSGSNTAVQKYGPLSGSPAWSSSVINTGSTTSENVPMLVSPVDILYMGTNQYVASMTSPTGSVTEGICVIPSKYQITTLDQVGTTVMIGTKQSLGGTISYVFPWDRVNINPNIPIPLNGAGVRQSKALGNILYAVSGNGGTVNVTNGSSAQEIKRLSMFNASPNDSIRLEPSAISVMNGGLLIGAGKTATSDDQRPVGIFYYKDNGPSAKAWSYFVPSHGLDGSAGQACRVGAVLGIGDAQFLASWYDGTNYGVDLFDTTRRYDSYSAYFVSPVWQVNNVVDKTALSRIEFKFAKKLAVSQGIRIEYRESIEDSWTLLGTWDYATNGASRDGFMSFGYSKPDLQVRVSLTTGTSNDLTPELVSLTIL